MARGVQQVLQRYNDLQDIIAILGIDELSPADGVNILTDMAVAADKSDEAKAEAARRRAEARLREKLSDEEVATINASLARALAQLRVRRRHRG